MAHRGGRPQYVSCVDNVNNSSAGSLTVYRVRSRGRATPSVTMGSLRQPPWGRVVLAGTTRGHEEWQWIGKRSLDGSSCWARSTPGTWGRSTGPRTSRSPKIDWVVDQRADTLCEAAERLSVLMDRLDEEGDDLPRDLLRQLVQRAEDLAEEAGEDLTSDERRHIARWRTHLEGVADRPTLQEIQSYAALLQPALRRAAREGRTTTWVELGQHFEAPLATLHPDDKVAILVEVDRDTPDDEPLLSALIAARDGAHPLYRQVLFNLDRVDLSADAVHSHWRLAVNRHFESQGTLRKRA